MTNHRQSTLENQQQLFDQACELIAAEYGTKIELDDVARRLQSSRRQLQRAFERVGSTGFRDFVTETRMRQSARLLANTNRTVRSVAAMVSYQQPAQFAKTFRLHFGVSPSAYRAGQRAAGEDDELIVG